MSTETGGAWARWRGIAIWAVFVLVVGQTIAGLSVVLLGEPAASDNSVLPPGVFVAVWVMLYPCLAVSIGCLRQLPSGPKQRRALAAAISVLVMAFLWLPLACAADDPWVPVYLDLVAAGLTYVALRLSYRVDRVCAYWLVPLAIWMPITTAISLVAAAG